MMGIKDCLDESNMLGKYAGFKIRTVRARFPRYYSSFVVALTA